MTDFKFKDITERIIGAAMKVHSTLGNGFPENIYQRAMVLQMEEDCLQFESECNMTVYYLNKPIGFRRVDFFVEGKICVELKALSDLEPVNFTQTRNYLEAFNMEVGLLINFGATSLQFRRLTNPKYKIVVNENPLINPQDSFISKS